MTLPFRTLQKIINLAGLVLCSLILILQFTAAGWGISFQVWIIVGFLWFGAAWLCAFFKAWKSGNGAAFFIPAILFSVFLFLMFRFFLPKNNPVTSGQISLYGEVVGMFLSVAVIVFCILGFLIARQLRVSEKR